MKSDLQKYAIIEASISESVRKVERPFDWMNRWRSGEDFWEARMLSDRFLLLENAAAHRLIVCKEYSW